MFHQNPFRGFGATGGWYLPFPITLAVGSYNSLFYCTGHDSVVLFVNWFAWFWSPSSYMFSDEPFLDRSRPILCKLAQMGSHPITFLWLWPSTDHEPHCWHVPITKIWRWTESTPRSRWWRSHMAGIYSDCRTREIILVCVASVLWHCCWAAGRASSL